MKSLQSKVFLLIFLATLARPARSFNTDQHRAATARAANDLDAQGASPDIARFKGLIGEWSGGVGWWYLSRNTTPGEQLAHVLNQTVDICTVPWNGGQFTQIYNRIFTRYNQRNYSDKSAGSEGAYVYMGSALHLIEDQASMPHGANVRHGACPSLTDGFDPDNFENEPLGKAPNVNRTGAQGNVTPLLAYLLSLRQTRALTGAYSSPSNARYWLRNEELTAVASFNPAKSGTPYDGEAEPEEPFFGAYGGPGYKDVYHDIEHMELYGQQGTQATDYAYFFLDNVSKLLPPLVSGFAVGNAGAISEYVGAQITFSLAENRTEYVDVDLYILETGQRIATETILTALDGAESPSGVAQTRNLGVHANWLAQPIQLFETKNDLSLLPYHAQVTTYWDGKLASGPALPSGSYTLCLTVKDRNGNGDACSSRATIRFDNVPPDLIASSGEGWLGDGVVTSDNNITIYATDKPDGAASGLKSIAVYQAVNGQFQFWFWTDRSAFSARFPGHDWFFVNACDNAGNCSPMRFGVFDEDEDVPEPPEKPNNPQIPGGSKPGMKTPPLPKPPAGPRLPPNTPRQHPRPAPFPNQPPCVVTGVGKCLPKPPAPQPPGPPLKCRWYDLRCYFEMIRNTPHDPNAIYGPEGSVTPGQMMTYTIEFENEGTGEALGVYVEDVLDPALDAATLNLRDMQTVDFASGTQSAANFPWTYDPLTRTVTLLAGDAASRHGGRFVLELRLKSDSPPGTVIRNQAVVFFPNALEATPTNTIISAVPLPTQLASIGASSGTYQSIARLETKLSAGTAPVSGQPVNITLHSNLLSALTDASGIAGGPVLLTTGAGHSDLTMRYDGDGFYYSPTSANADFVTLKRSTLLQAPKLSVGVTGLSQFALTLTDDRGQAMESQSEHPRTVYLESLDENGAASPLASGLLSGTSVNFSIAAPQPFKLSWNIRARFDGDDFYSAASTTGTLTLLDGAGPVLAIQSPSGGAYHQSQSISIAFSGVDNADPAPAVQAALIGDGGAVLVQNGESISVSSFSAGTWRLTVNGTDWAGNVTNLEGPTFTVDEALPDDTPPSLSLTPTHGSSVATSLPTISVQFDDADSGVDLASVRLAIDSIDVTSFTSVSAASATFIPIEALGQGTHTVSASISDLTGNQATASATFFIDTLPPQTALIISGLAAGATNQVLTSTDTLELLAADAGAGVTETLYAVDGATVPSVYVSTFSLAPGAHTLSFHSLDRLGNDETPRAFNLTVLPPDQDSPTLALTPADGAAVTSARPVVAASYADASGVDAGSVRLSLDGVDVTSAAVVTASSAAYVPPSDLAQGSHTATAQAADFAGNVTTAAATFVIDSIAPATELLVNGLPAGATNLVVITTDTIGLSAADGGTGVLETLYALDGATVPLVFNSTFSLSAGTHELSFQSRDRAGNLEILQTAALVVLGEDVTHPNLSLTPPNGSTVTTATPRIVALYSDSERGVDSTSARLSLDGVFVATPAFVTASSMSFTPGAALSQGTHTVTVFVSDLAGNAASASSTFFIDSLPPVTALLVNGLSAGSTNLVLASTDAVSFAATDAGVGVLETRYSVDGASESVFGAAFFLSPGNLTLAFRSLDREGNTEAVRSVSVTITSPSSDTTPPLVRLDFPGAAALGVEQAVGGSVNARGAVSDTSAVNWILEAAPGASATTGFTRIASGSGNLSGLIAAWNTTSLSGYQTLRLRATDAFGNEASAATTVFVGSPVFTFAIGRKDSNVIVAKIKNPTGIAVRTDGLIWVANGADEDELLLLTSSGSVVAELDGDPAHGRGRRGHEHGDGHDNDDEDRGFRNPQGLALDSADNLYVADKGNDRVVKLSADGSQVLLQIAKLDNHGRSKPGSGTGELRQPQDVAVDANGDIYVADSGNHRIQVFDATGAFLRQFGPGVLLSTSEVRGIALTAEGLWVSDKEQERVFLFSRAGASIKSIGDAGSAVGEISRMRGLASDRLGALYVVEPNRDRTQKFDPLGKGLLAFGSKAGLSQADKHSKRYLTQPIDAAVAPDGSIWITDTGRDRIVRYALPVSGGYGVAAYSAGGDAVTSSSVEPAKRVVDHRDGAKVERDDGAGVSVPEGALVADLEITVDKGDDNLDKEEKTAKRKEMKITAVSEEVQYGPEGTTFSAPVTLTLPYDANLIASQGMREDELKVYYWNPTLKDWQAMPSVVDKQNKTVSALTNHFSAYQVGALGGIGVAAIDDFGLRDGYAFPNPSRSGSAVTFRLQPGSVDSIEVRVYDLSGRKIHSSSDFRFQGAIDDGNGKGVQNTYDHTWDVSGVGSGVYTYVMTAKKAGQSDIRKSGKVGVIK